MPGGYDAQGNALPTRLSDALWAIISLFCYLLFAKRCRGVSSSLRQNFLNYLTETLSL